MPHSLTPRQFEVAALVAAGYTAGEIAAILHRSPRTVERTIANAAARLPGQGSPRSRLTRFILAAHAS